MTTAELWRRGQEGWPRRFPIAQFPNAPLLVAFAGRGIGVVADGPARDAGRTVYRLGLGVWAWQEMTDGVNWFRRLAGAGMLVRLVAQTAGERPRRSAA